ncbi:MAG: hypothetical protein Q9162_003752 [Coniocarpon cinnabarinum]
MTEITLYDATRHEHLARAFADLHAACTLENPMTVANFAPPYTAEKLEKMTQWWAGRFADAGPGGSDCIIMAFTEDSRSEKQLSGYVVLHMPFTESGPFRAEVQKLFVSPDFRQQGIARKLMMRLEEVAKANGRTMLVSEHQFSRRK